MANRKFGLPFVMSEPEATQIPWVTTSPDPEPGVGGSAHGGIGKNGGKTAPVACSFDTWLENYAQDYYKDGIIDFNDYGQWWADSGLGQKEWSGINSGIPFKWESKK